MRRIAIYGAGNFGRYIFKELEQTNKYEPIVYIDNNVNGHAWDKRGLPVVDVNLFKDD